MNRICIRVEKGILKNNEGLKYFQDAINKNVNLKSSVILEGFNDSYHPFDNEPCTEIWIKTNFVNPITLCEELTTMFNRRKRFIKNK